MDEASGTLTVEHEEIPDFMPAMTMEFRVRPGDAKMAQPGMRIRARMTRDEDGGFRLERIWPVDEAGAAAIRAAGDRLAKQAKALSAGYYYGEGDALPDFALVDQYGRTVTAAALEGKAFVLNFIFTRCTDAKMCPLSTFKMAQLQREVAARGIRGLEFLSVTLDPVYDTPGVLRDYADGYGIDGANFRFLTGPKEQVQLMLRSLGVTRIGEGVDITHSLATVLVDGSRKILLRSEKSAWEPEAYLAAIRQELAPVGRIFMIGDSTMATKQAKAFPETGWGQALPGLMDAAVTIENHALNGRSSKSFRDEGRWEPVLEKLQPGDVVVIQFGHNDQKSQDATRYADPATDYPANLVRYAKEAREKGAEPIFATSICRRKFDESGQWVDTHGAYPDAVRRVAAELEAPLVDLEALTKALLIEMGPEESVSLFLHVKPGEYEGYPNGKVDDTHLVGLGAEKVASLFLEDLRRQGHRLAAWAK